MINVDYDKSKSILIVNKASDPIDIYWRNMGEIISLFSFKRFFLFVMALLCVLFLSSPAVMLTKLQKVDPTSFFYFKWTEKFGVLAPYLQKSMPTMILLLINVIVIQILDATCVIERYDAHSKYQGAVYTKCVIYMILNMFIIPVLTISSGGKTVY